MTTQNTVKLGMRFHSVVADANILFEVKKRAGKGVWRCSPLDTEYGSDERVFTEAQIRRAVSWEKAFETAANEADAFYASLKIGQVVHYDDGFDQFIRCEVVLKDGRKQLKRVALVGEWDKHDLPYRHVDGTIHKSYNVKGVEEGRVFRPSDGCIFECPRYQRTPGKRNKRNPATMPALDLSVPPMTADEEKQAALWQAVGAARTALDNSREADPKEMLLKAQAVIEAALKG